MAIWDASLMGYWRFEETATPWAAAAGSASLGTESGGNPPSSVGGKINNAVFFGDFAGINYVGSALDLATTDSFSLSLWIYPTVSANYYTMVNQYGTGTRKIYLLLLPTTREISMLSSLNSGYNAVLNTWQHVVYTYASGGTNTGTEIIYVDGVQRATRTGAMTAPNTGAFRVGWDSLSGNHPFQGRIDELALTRRVWTPTEVTGLYNSGAGLAYPNEPAITQSQAPRSRHQYALRRA